MAVVLAPHHCDIFSGYYADKYLNDPWVWSTPFLWSHCHARSRPSDFGTGRVGPSFVRGKDAVFFMSVHPRTQDVVCDCVFVIDAVVSIEEAECRFGMISWERCLHFDQLSEPRHARSRLTRIADPELSFVPLEPVVLGPWIDAFVDVRKRSVADYFSMRNRKSVRLVTGNGDELYERIHQATVQPLGILPREMIANQILVEAAKWR